MARYNPAKAYLEQARCFLHADIEIPSQDKYDVPPPNLVLAQIASTYIFSYMAIVAFVAHEIDHLWNEPDRPLQLAYPKAKSVRPLLNGDLKDLKECLKALCRHCTIPYIHEEKPTEWNQLLSVLKDVRDYMVHPNPDPQAFHDTVTKAGADRTWDFAPGVAQAIISYFYEATHRPVPEWLRSNQEFVVDRIRALRVAREDEA